MMKDKEERGIGEGPAKEEGRVAEDAKSPVRLSKIEQKLRKKLRILKLQMGDDK